MPSLPPEYVPVLRQKLRRVVKRMHADYSQEIEAAYARGLAEGRDEVVVGLKALAKLNGSGAAVMDMARVVKAAAHAPAGGVTVQGKEYRGGEFIPGEVMEQATKEEKDAVHGANPNSSETPNSSPKPASSPAIRTVERTRKLLASDKPLSQVIAAVQQQLEGHTHTELAEIKHHLGIKAGGAKAEMARKIAERAASVDKTNRRHYTHQAMSVDQVHDLIQSHKDAGTLDTADGIRSVVQAIGTGLTVKQVSELKQRLGIKAGGAKHEMATKIALRAAQGKKADAVVKEDTAATAEGATKPIHEMTKEEIGKRLDSLLGKGGEIEKAYEEVEKARHQAKWQTHVHQTSDGKHGVYINPGAGKSTSEHLVSTHDTEEEARTAAGEAYRQHVSPHKQKVKELESLMEKLRVAEDQAQLSPKADSGLNESPKSYISNDVYTTQLPVEPEESGPSRHEDAFISARNTDKQFNGDGRYEGELWMKLSKKHPNDKMPKLSKPAAEHIADEHEADGKPVPPEVLADYPDLAAKYSTTPSAPASPAKHEPVASGANKTTGIMVENGDGVGNTENMSKRQQSSPKISDREMAETKADIEYWSNSLKDTTLYKPGSTAQKKMVAKIKAAKKKIGDTSETEHVNGEELGRKIAGIKAQLRNSTSPLASQHRAELDRLEAMVKPSVAKIEGTDVDQLKQNTADLTDAANRLRELGQAIGNGGTAQTLPTSAPASPAKPEPVASAVIGGNKTTGIVVENGDVAGNTENMSKPRSGNASAGMRKKDNQGFQDKLELINPGEWDGLPAHVVDFGKRRGFSAARTRDEYAENPDKFRTPSTTPKPTTDHAATAAGLKSFIGSLPGGKATKEQLDAALAPLDSHDQSQLLEIAKQVEADAGLTPRSTAKAIREQIKTALTRRLKTSQNVNHDDPTGDLEHAKQEAATMVAVANGGGEKAPHEMTKAELLANNREDHEEHPDVGSWRMVEGTGELEQLKTYDPHKLELKEEVGNIKDHPTYPEYVQRAKNGEQPPPVMVVDGPNGMPQSSGRRRTLAAREAGTTLRGWHYQRVPGTYSAKTHEEYIADALAAGKVVPAKVLADYPELAAKYGKKPPRV